MKPRYERNIEALTAEEVEILHRKKVCVIGCGGLGGYIAEILARIGVLHITIVDYDVFDESNLNRQLFSTQDLLGESKVDSGIARLKAVNPDVVVVGIKEKLEEHNALEILSGHDVIVDALDNISARLILTKTASQLGTVLIHGSIGGWYGQVACVFPNDGLIEKIYKNVKGDRGVEKKLGNLPFTASTVASMQAAECVKVLLGREVQKNTLVQVDLLNQEFNTIHFR